mgnify:FL=1
MKKILTTLVLLLTLINGALSVKAMNYDEAIKQSKPIVLLIYSDWADDLDKVNKSFVDAQNSYSNTYNFVRLNIASQEAKNFNKKYYFYPNLPYILLLKDSGRISRYLTKENIINTSSFYEKLKFFIN